LCFLVFFGLTAVESVKNYHSKTYKVYRTPFRFTSVDEIKNSRGELVYTLKQNHFGSWGFTLYDAEDNERLEARRSLVEWTKFVSKSTGRGVEMSRKWFSWGYKFGFTYNDVEYMWREVPEWKYTMVLYRVDATVNKRGKVTKERVQLAKVQRTFWQWKKRAEITVDVEGFREMDYSEGFEELLFASAVALNEEIKEQQVKQAAVAAGGLLTLAAITQRSG